jgi:hypothetical protein
MQGFRKHIQECMEGEALLPAIEGDSDCANFFDPSVRESTNFVLADVTDEPGVTPIVTYERVRLILMGLGYSIPPVSARPELFGDNEGEEIFGMTRPLPPNSPEPAICFLYFAFCASDDNTYDILAEIVTTEELEEILHEESE